MRAHSAIAVEETAFPHRVSGNAVDFCLKGLKSKAFSHWMSGNARAFGKPLDGEKLIHSPEIIHSLQGF
ncbi:hypothetical protein [Corynebacterium urogenitale]